MNRFIQLVQRLVDIWTVAKNESLRRIAVWSRKTGWFRPLTIGERGERAATRHLKKHGLRIITTGFRNRLGEIDIVALDKDTVVFAEVKTRRHHGAGHPAEAVDERKQQQLGRLALAFCKQHGLGDTRARFDIVAVTWPDTNKSPTIKHIPNAFALPSVGIRG